MMLTQKTGNNKGAAAVEFALVASLFFLLIFGIIDFGMYFFTQQSLQFGTREGTRLATVGGILNDEYGNPLSREESVRKEIKENVSMAIDPESSDFHIYIFPVESDYSDPDPPATKPGDWPVSWSWPPTPERWMDYLESHPDAGNPDAFMRVRTRYSYNFITPMIGAFFPAGKDLIEVQATYRNEILD